MNGGYILLGIALAYIVPVLVYMHPWNKKNRPDEPWHRDDECRGKRKAQGVPADCKSAV